MFVWDLTWPTRDGAMENDIPIHEMTHDLTSRLTGGGTATCLQTLEAGGMGVWVMNWGPQKPGEGRQIRRYPYSTSPTTNPLRYSSIVVLNEVHDIGEVGNRFRRVTSTTLTLHNVYADLVDAHGWSANARTDATTNEGNVIFLRLLVDALAIQPCNPILVTGRDPWIQADQNRYGGVNRCLLWKSFASRGLGVNADNYVDSTCVPSDCEQLVSTSSSSCQ
ncbi:hypothetical protein L218DRAFT_1001379 [Marasmius fiardii PR-910]|nr:hypothetical protein L218DRAFT_1001379 [Marasmius fiardii PR-910]